MPGISGNRSAKWQEFFQAKFHNGRLEIENEVGGKFFQMRQTPFLSIRNLS
jgi:hypothetical protein